MQGNGLNKKKNFFFYKSLVKKIEVVDPQAKPVILLLRNLVEIFFL